MIKTYRIHIIRINRIAPFLGGSDHSRSMNFFDVLDTRGRLDIEPPSAPVWLFVVNRSALSGGFVSSSFSWATIALGLEEELVVPAGYQLFF
jgi:hypothetical protein